MSKLDPALVASTLATANSSNFEMFGQITLQESVGVEFAPTGGMHDGGQDGFIRDVQGKATHFAQVSIEQDVRGKVRRTIQRLKEGGRAVEVLYFVTNQEASNRDFIEADIQKSTGVTVRIHDRRWLQLQIDTNDAVEKAFLDRFSSGFASAGIMQSHVQKRYEASERLSVLVYLENHAQSEPLDTGILQLSIDAAIFMALKDTDPDLGVFRSDQEIITFVEEFFPPIKSQAALLVRQRLLHLRTKQSDTRIRYYSQGDRYCLPFEVRSDFSQKNALLTQLSSDFWQSVRRRALGHTNDLSENDLSFVESAISKAVGDTFERQGLNLLALFERKEVYEEIRTYEFVKDALTEAKVDRDQFGKLYECCCSVIRGLFYDTSEPEHEYLFHLFRLYSIEFVIRGDERVSRYFQNMVRQLRLYVGADILIRALSETMVKPTSQATQNTLKLLSAAGAKLYLTETVLNEVYNHIVSEDREFQNFFKPWEAHATLAEVRQSEKILIRAYFYAKLEPDRHQSRPSSWEGYLSQFGNAAWFHEDAGKQYFATYLLTKFGMEFVSKSEMLESITDYEIKKLTDKIDTTKAHRELAYNDACMIIFVREERKKRGELVSDNIYGYSTWWLTEEHIALQIARSAGLKEGIKMPPQFLINFIAASPAMRGIANTSGPSFPINFGLKITQRVSPSVMKSFLESAVEATKVDQAAAGARIRAAANKLISIEARLRA